MFTAAYVALALGACTLLLWLARRLVIPDNDLVEISDDTAETELIGTLGVALVAMSVGFIAIGYLLGS